MQWPGGCPAIVTSSPRSVFSVERLDLDDRRTVVAADPEHRPRARLFDEYAADIGVGPGQEIFGDLAGLGIEARDQIVEHRAGPHFRGILARYHVVGHTPLARQPVLLDFSVLWIKEADRVGAIFGEPEPVLRVDPAAAWSRSFRWRDIDRRLVGLGIADANARAAEVQQVDVVLQVGRHAI